MAFVAIPFAILERRNRFQRLAERHMAEASRLSQEKARATLAGLDDRPVSLRADYELKLTVKYAKAAQYPWLPLADDPPEPE